MARLSDANVSVAKEIIGRYPRPKSALIPLLHLAQEQDGYVTNDAMAHIAELIGHTPAEVYGTATFYEMFKFEPVGRYLVNICGTMSCMLMGADELMHHAEQRARHRRAHVDQVLADRLELEHLVERRRAQHLGRGDADQFGEVRHRVVGDVAVLLLREMQQRDQRRLGLRIAPDDLFRQRHVGVGQPTHASPFIGRRPRALGPPRR